MWQQPDTLPAVNLRGFRASVNRRFEGGIPDFMNGIPEVHWRNPKLKSLNSMPDLCGSYHIKYSHPILSHGTNGPLVIRKIHNLTRFPRV